MDDKQELGDNVTVNPPCKSCGESHEPATKENIADGLRKLKRRYRFFVVAFLASWAATVASIWLYNTYLGSTALFLSLTMFSHTNLSYLSDIKQQLELITKTGQSKPYNDAVKILGSKHGHGQYL